MRKTKQMLPLTGKLFEVGIQFLSDLVRYIIWQECLKLKVKVHALIERTPPVFCAAVAKLFRSDNFSKKVLPERVA